MNRENLSENHLHVTRILAEADPQALENSAAECVDVCVELSRLKPTANPAFQQELKAQMLQKMQKRPHRAQATMAKHRWTSAPRMWAFLVLFGLLLIPLIWFIAQPGAVDAQDILERAHHSIANPLTSDMQTLEVIEEVSIYYEVNTTHARIHKWYRGPDQWRTEYTGVTHPYSGVNDGTLISVNDGTAIWQYIANDNTVQITEAPAPKEGDLD